MSSGSNDRDQWYEMGYANISIYFNDFQYSEENFVKYWKNNEKCMGTLAQIGLRRHFLLNYLEKAIRT